MHGKVASVSPERGFGFITPDEEGGEVFFHRSALHGVEFEDLAAGVAVELECPLTGAVGDRDATDGQQRAAGVAAEEDEAVLTGDVGHLTAAG